MCHRRCLRLKGAMSAVCSFNVFDAPLYAQYAGHLPSKSSTDSPCRFKHAVQMQHTCTSVQTLSNLFYQVSNLLILCGRMQQYFRSQVLHHCQCRGLIVVCLELPHSGGAPIGPHLPAQHGKERVQQTSTHQGYGCKASIQAKQNINAFLPSVFQSAAHL